MSNCSRMIDFCQQASRLESLTAGIEAAVIRARDEDLALRIQLPILNEYPGGQTVGISLIKPTANPSATTISQQLNTQLSTAVRRRVRRKRHFQ